MKIVYRRRHVTRPIDYEAVEIMATVEIDTDSESDMEPFEGMDYGDIGEELSGIIDDLVDKDVDRALQLRGNHIEDSHLWDFYNKD